MMTTRRAGPASVLAALALLACGSGAEREEATLIAMSAQDQFWAAMQRQCGRAYPGRLVLEPPGDDMLTGTEELVVHWRECADSQMRVPFHIEIEADGSWDRSRTWVYMRHAGSLELRHDHRHEDGSEHERNWYGASTLAEGGTGWQEFVLTERTAPDGSRLGWRIEIVPGERYTYGTIRGEEYTWRVDFDLSREVAAPPPPWGSEP